MDQPLKAHAFVDESKGRRGHGYLLVAASVMPCDVGRARKQVAALKLQNQRRIHFTAESDTRRKTILSVMEATVAHSATVYDASAYRDPKEARDVAMAALVDDLAKAGAELLVIEKDDQAVASDRKIIRQRSELAGCQDILRYQHLRAYEEPLLAIPDAVAWAWEKGGAWRRRASGLIAHVSEL
jgi:hypothetical protein